MSQENYGNGPSQGGYGSDPSQGGYGNGPGGYGNAPGQGGYGGGYGNVPGDPAVPADNVPGPGYGVPGGNVPGGNVPGPGYGVPGGAVPGGNGLGGNGTGGSFPGGNGPGGNGPEGWYVPEPGGPAGKPPRRTKRIAIGAGIGAVAIVGLATVLVLTQTGSSANTGHDNVSLAGATAKPTTPKPTPSGFQPTASTPAGEAQQTAEAFLAAWQSGNFKLAASYTDDPATAQTVLTAYGTDLNLSGLHLAAQSATAAGLVAFSVSASVSTSAAAAASAAASASSTSPAGSTSSASAADSTAPGSGTWSYTSHLTAYAKNGGWYVQWNPGLVAPSLSDTVHPVAIPDEPGPAKVTDSAGNNLANSSQTALQDVSTDIKQGVKTTQGTPGVEIVYESSSGGIAPGLTDVLSQPVGTGTIATTIDPTFESLATTAVDQLPRSSMVVLRPSTGAILAVANNAQPYDIALDGTLAPGSSMKVVTSTGLLVDGLLPQGINTQVGCPLVEDVQGVKIHNSTSSANSSAGTEDFEPNNTPFSTDFAQSCNNAFTQWWQQMAGGKLASAASTYYGLNQPWDIGLGAKNTYFSMPSDQSGSELAEELYGQGVIEANPLSMASIAATVDTGDFHQPYLLNGLTDKASATPLPSSVQSSLYTMMREVITDGTAEAVGFGPGVYGKTGTAEAAANKDNNPNGWMIVFDPSKDLAIASVVVDSNFGAMTAGPEVKYVLDHS